MAKHILMLACRCSSRLCHKAMYVHGDPEKGEVRLEIRDGERLSASVVLRKTEIKELGDWLTGVPTLDNLLKGAKGAKEVMPWEGE